MTSGTATLPRAPCTLLVHRPGLRVYQIYRPLTKFFWGHMNDVVCHQKTQTRD
jgi:hypothetical protein